MFIFSIRSTDSRSLTPYILFSFDFGFVFIDALALALVSGSRVGRTI